MSLDLKDLHKGLKKKWFKIEKRQDYYCRFYINGQIKTDVRSKVGGYSKEKYKTLGDNIVSQIYKCLHFDNKSQFLQFIECPFTKEKYQEMLLSKEKIRLPV